MTSRPTRLFRTILILVSVVLTYAPLTAQSQSNTVAECPQSSFTDAYESRVSRAPSARTEEQLRELMERPVALVSTAEWIDHPEARIETITDYHAVYPLVTAELLTVTQDNSRLTRYIPNLVANEVLCTAADGTMRIRQRSEIRVLFLTIVSDFVLNVQTDRPSPERGFTLWTFHESIESDLVYSFGSFYAETVEIDDEEYVYARHYARTGINSGIIGARALIAANLDGQTRDWFRAVTEETERRFGGPQ